MSGHLEDPTGPGGSGRTVGGVGPLSKLPAERSLQQLVIAMAVVGLGGLLVFGGIVLFSGTLSDVEQGETVSFGDTPGYAELRWVVIVLAVLIALRLAQLAVAHRDQMRTVDGLRRQYLSLCVLGCVLYNVFFPWPAFVVHGLVAVYLLTLRRVAPEQREGRISGGTFG